MTHINPDGKAISGPQPKEMKLLHIYSPPFEHCEAKIVGNYAGLVELKKAIDLLLLEKLKEVSSGVVFATDGEGYVVIVTLFPDDWNDPKWKESPPLYRAYDV